MIPAIKRIFLYIDISFRLGVHNVLYIAWYRATLKTGIRKLFFPQKKYTVHEDLFMQGGTEHVLPVQWKESILKDAEKITKGNLRYYGYHWKRTGDPPNWFFNPFNGKQYPGASNHWTKLSAYNPRAGDIKNIWEASRFEWLVTLARAYAVSTDPVYLQTINKWLSDWIRKNPPNTGPNWKCGQEASIRIFNVLNSALILNQWNTPSSALIEFIYVHLERIRANIRYAIALDNNHGTSEAAGLFIGGSWLASTGLSVKQREDGERMSRKGRKLIENRVSHLIEEDGSFSQHSVTYHRVLLDTLIFTEVWRRYLNQPPFSGAFYERVRGAINWLVVMTDPVSGDAPNLGPNDGALFLNLHQCDYRDFRPTIQTASVLFDAMKQFSDGPWEEPLVWFDLQQTAKETTGATKESKLLPGGYVIMCGTESWGMLRYPRFRFRPSHNDVFHFDLWYRGKNILRDSGSYSYNPGENVSRDYFQSVKSHNTVTFDDNEQMPRLGRFLYGKWIKPLYIGDIEDHNDNSRQWSGAYIDVHGNLHRRTISWKEKVWTVQDEFSGKFDEAVLRWRLPLDNLRLENNKIFSSWGMLEIISTGCTIEIEEEYESRYYWDMKKISVVKILSNRNTNVVTRIQLTD